MSTARLAAKAAPVQPFSPPIEHWCDHPACAGRLDADGRRIWGAFAIPTPGGLRHYCAAHVPAEVRAEWAAYAGERRGVAA